MVWIFYKTIYEFNENINFNDNYENNINES